MTTRTTRTYFTITLYDVDGEIIKTNTYCGDRGNREEIANNFMTRYVNPFPGRKIEVKDANGNA